MEKSEEEITLIEKEEKIESPSPLSNEDKRSFKMEQFLEDCRTSKREWITLEKKGKNFTANDIDVTLCKDAYPFCFMFWVSLTVGCLIPLAVLLPIYLILIGKVVFFKKISFK